MLIFSHVRYPGGCFAVVSRIDNLLVVLVVGWSVRYVYFT